jgi:hypothetical protein
VQHYISLCERVGLDPASKPFDYLVLSGKEVLYANKGAAEQLRKIHGVSISILSRETVGDCYVVTARATLPDGRSDESVGAVSIKGLGGESLCNAIMKTETKAKRRVTLSALGLGMLDESELDTIPRDRVQLPSQATKPVKVPDVVDCVTDALAKKHADLKPFLGVAINTIMDTEQLTKALDALVEVGAMAKTSEGKSLVSKTASAIQTQLNELQKE